MSYGHAHLLLDPSNHCTAIDCRRLATAVTDAGHRLCAGCALVIEYAAARIMPAPEGRMLPAFGRRAGRVRRPVGALQAG